MQSGHTKIVVTWLPFKPPINFLELVVAGYWLKQCLIGSKKERTTRAGYQDDHALPTFPYDVLFKRPNNPSMGGALPSRGLTDVLVEWSDGVVVLCAARHMLTESRVRV